MTDQELDRLMRRVLLDAIELEENERGAGEQVAFTPSRAHRRQMRAMLRDPLRWAKNKTRPLWQKVLRSAAVVLLAVSVGFGGVLAVSPSARAAVQRWLTTWYERYVIYDYYGEEQSEKLPLYEITWLPEGFVESIDERIERPNLVFIIYRKIGDEENSIISMSYRYMQDGGGFSIGWQNAEVRPVKVNGMEGMLFLEPEGSGIMSMVTWIDEEKNIQFDIQAEAGELDIMHMAESVSLVKTPK
ncbi:MAG: DUF4367 domain-containing protein [Clostridia bacterium]|nr:DUF4367 domain-containing protein [Clostridia bacterium]